MNTGIIDCAEIFWLSVLLVMTSSVFARPIDIDRGSLGKPLWIMSKAGNQMPNVYGSQLLNKSFEENDIKIRPFINWNGILKMVVPIYRSPDFMSDTREVVPDVYNWNTLPCFRNNGGTRSWFGSNNDCDGENILDENDSEKKIFILICVILAAIVLCVIVYAICLCKHHPNCCNLHDSDGSSSNIYCSTCSSTINDKKQVICTI